MKEYEFHEAANIFPLDEEHLDELAKDIREHGQQVAIELFDGLILDGRRRYLACGKAGVAPRFMEVDVADPVQYVLSLNLHRRHLSPSQASMVGARAREIYDEQAKERMSAGQKSGGRGHTKNSPVNLPESLLGDSRDHAAKAVGVSGKSIDYATKVIKTENPKLIKAVEDDLIAVSTAARAASLSEAEQNAMVERVTQAAAEGRKPRHRPTVIQEEPEPTANGKIRVLGVGVDRAHEAINCLRKIPRNDGLRKRGFQIVADWIKQNS